MEEYTLLSAVLHVAVALKRTREISLNFSFPSGTLIKAFWRDTSRVFERTVASSCGGEKNLGYLVEQFRRVKMINMAISGVTLSRS